MRRLTQILPVFNSKFHMAHTLNQHIKRIKQNKKKRWAPTDRVADNEMDVNVCRFVLPIVLIFLIADNYSMTQNNVFYGLYS